MRPPVRAAARLLRPAALTARAFSRAPGLTPILASGYSAPVLA